MYLGLTNISCSCSCSCFNRPVSTSNDSSQCPACARPYVKDDRRVSLSKSVSRIEMLVLTKQAQRLTLFVHIISLFYLVHSLFCVKASFSYKQLWIMFVLTMCLEKNIRFLFETMLCTLKCTAAMTLEVVNSSRVAQPPSGLYNSAMVYF